MPFQLRRAGTPDSGESLQLRRDVVTIARGRSVIADFRPTREPLSNSPCMSRERKRKGDDIFGYEGGKLTYREICRCKIAIKMVFRGREGGCASRLRRRMCEGAPVSGETRGCNAAVLTLFESARL